MLPVRRNRKVNQHLSQRLFSLRMSGNHLLNVDRSWDFLLQVSDFTQSLGRFWAFHKLLGKFLSTSCISSTSSFLHSGQFYCSTNSKKSKQVLVLKLALLPYFSDNVLVENLLIAYEKEARSLSPWGRWWVHVACSGLLGQGNFVKFKIADEDPHSTDSSVSDEQFLQD